MASDIERIRARIVKIEAQIDAAYDTAQEYEIISSRRVKRAPIDKLNSELAKLRRRLRILQGITTRNVADFSGDYDLRKGTQL